MSADEIVRVISYAFAIPGLAYVAFRVWNALVMPEMLRKPVSIVIGLQSMIYLMFFVGLFLLRFSQPIPILLYVNTILIAIQAISVGFVATKVLLKNKTFVVVSVIITVFVLMTM